MLKYTVYRRGQSMNLLYFFKLISISDSSIQHAAFTSSKKFFFSSYQSHSISVDERKYLYPMLVWCVANSCLTQVPRIMSEIVLLLDLFSVLGSNYRVVSDLILVDIKKLILNHTLRNFSTTACMFRSLFFSVKSLF